jgi:hypothetical protein
MVEGDVFLMQQSGSLAFEETMHDPHALACRAAALAFVNGVTDGWGVGDLAMWLSGSYRSVTRRAASAADPRARTELAHLDEVVRDARWRVLAELEATALARGRAAFATRAISLGHIDRAVRTGVAGWVPLDVPGMRLRDRVLSLFAVDALTYTRDYERLLFVCHRCEKVAFDVVARSRGACLTHVSAHPEQ